MSNTETPKEMMRRVRHTHLPETEQEYFQSKIEVVGKCWIWKGASWGGYGQYTFRGKSQIASRASFRLFKGNLDPKLCILHNCDNRKCVNPDHLYQGTKKQNRKDFMERHPKAKELIGNLVKNSRKAITDFWANMSEVERKTFIKNRSDRQKEIKRNREANRRG